VKDIFYCSQKTSGNAQDEASNDLTVVNAKQVAIVKIEMGPAFAFGMVKKILNMLDHRTTIKKSNKYIEHF